MQYNIHLPYYNETFLYGYGFGIRSFFQVASVLRQTEIIRPPHSEKMNMPLNNNFLVNTSSSFLITEIPPEKNEGPYLSIFQLPV